MISSLVFQPIASILQFGMLTYLYKIQEWKSFTYGIILLVYSIIISVVIYVYKLNNTSDLYFLLLAASIFANLFWFTAMIKLLKIKSFDESDLE